MANTILPLLYLSQENRLLKDSPQRAPLLQEAERGKTSYKPVHWDGLDLPRPREKDIRARVDKVTIDTPDNSPRLRPLQKGI